jgi:predicted RNA-binding Zn-ribbon protein involved in translation (DUF1610 family)
VLHDSISLHRLFKTGKPRKNPEVMLSYSEFTAEVFIEPDGSESNRRSAMPYHVFGPRLGRTLSFQNMSRALEAFWAEARGLAPALAPPEAPDVLVALCPSCHAALDRVPKRRVQCPSCGQPIVVRGGRFYTDDEARGVDTCAKIGAPPERLMAVRDELSKRTGRAVGASEAAWELLNEAARGARHESARRSAYLAMAQFLWDGGQDYREAMLKQHESQLGEWAADEDPGGLRVEVIAAKDSCPACRALGGAQLTLTEARRRKLLPVPGCTTRVGSNHPYGWCRCVYDPRP